MPCDSRRDLCDRDCSPRPVPTPHSVIPVTLALVLLATAGCGDPPTTESGPGSLRVTITTSGEDLDQDGYALRVDGTYLQTVTMSGVGTFPDLASGTHLIELSGVAENCSAPSGNRLSVTVKSGQTARATFAVECLGTGVQVLVPTSGLDPDSGLTVLVDGITQASVFPNSVARITRLSEGLHQVALANVSANCTVTDPNPRSVNVVFKQVTPISFPMTCVATTGSIEVRTATTGSDQDPSGYMVEVNAWPPRVVAHGINQTTIVTTLPGGDYRVSLKNVAANCTVAGDNPRNVAVAVGRSTRDTARVAFQVTCTSLWEFAFDKAGSVMVSSASGAEIEFVAYGDQPAWSPDGTRLAYSCGNICITGFDGTGTFRLPAGSRDGYDASPAWSPDGGKIAAVGYDCEYVDYYYYSCYWAGLFLIDQRGPVPSRSRISLPAGLTALEPTWSPDGRWLGFTCESNLVTDICLVGADGSGFQLLTKDVAADGNPAWSPDGSSIAFHTNRFGGSYEIVLIQVGDRVTTRVAPGIVGRDPTWSPDGMQIAFAGEDGLFVMNADGSGRTRLTTGSDWRPAWRP